MLGLLAALTTKLAGVGSAVKAVVATTAALTMALAGGAVAGIVPMAADSVDAAATAPPAAEQAPASLGAVAPTPSGPEVPAGAEASVTPPPATASGGLTPPTGGAWPDVPAVPAIPTGGTLPVVPACVTNLIPAPGAVPDPSQLVAQLPGCIISVVTENLPLDVIESVIDAANLPVDVAACLSSVVSSIPGFVGGELSGVDRLLSACLPTGPIPGPGSLPGPESLPRPGSLPDGGAFTDGFSFPGAGAFPGFPTGR